VFIKEI